MITEGRDDREYWNQRYSEERYCEGCETELDSDEDPFCEYCASWYEEDEDE